LSKIEIGCGGYLQVNEEDTRKNGKCGEKTEEGWKQVQVTPRVCSPPTII